IHVVNGLWAEPSFAAALMVLVLSQSRFLIYAEAPDPTSSRLLAKRLIQRVFGAWVVRRAAGILPISSFAAPFFTGLGASGRSLYPFGYFRAAMGTRPSAEDRKQS